MDSKALFVGALFLSIGLAGCSGGSRSFPDEPGLGPTWTFVDIEGTEHSRDTAAGSPSVLFFMATWCAKCQATAPDLAKVHTARGNNVSFYTLSWDPQEDASDLREWQSHYKQNWPHGIDSGSQVARTFGVTSQSSVVVLDASGDMVKRWIYDDPTAAELNAALDDAATREMPTTS